MAVTRDAWVRWTSEHTHYTQHTAPVKQVGMVRFLRDDGLDPRIDPEQNGTHLSRGRPTLPLHSQRELPASSCGITKPGFSDYGPIDGITCPDCAAMLAAQLLQESEY